MDPITKCDLLRPFSWLAVHFSETKPNKSANDKLARCLVHVPVIFVVCSEFYWMNFLVDRSPFDKRYRNKYSACMDGLTLGILEHYIWISPCRTFPKRIIVIIRLRDVTISASWSFFVDIFRIFNHVVSLKCITSSMSQTGEYPVIAS